MSVTSTEKDVDTLTLTVVASFDATPDQVWEVWEDPRKLERWWGPPSFPATFSRHDFAVPGESRYFMSGPNGEAPKGWWRFERIERPHRLDIANGLAGEDGEPEPDLEPTAMTVTLEAVGGGTRMTTVTRFADLDQMEQLIALGMDEGMTQAMGQIDAVLQQDGPTGRMEACGN